MSYIPESAVMAIAQDWKEDPGTLPWLKDRVQHEKNQYVRRSAIQALAQGWKDDPHLFEILYDRALHDPFEREDDWQTNPRQTALEAIIKNYLNHPQTLELLNDRANHDADEEVKAFARKQLDRWGDRGNANIE
jgi:HEAT repeats